jgi:hypothetical protein
MNFGEVYVALRQGVIDRTPLGLFIKQHRELALSGTAEGAEAIARMTTGIGAGAALWTMMDGWKDG